MRASRRRVQHELFQHCIVQPRHMLRCTVNMLDTDGLSLCACPLVSVCSTACLRACLSTYVCTDSRSSILTSSSPSTARAALGPNYG